MAINSYSTTSKFTSELDKFFVLKSATNMLIDNSFAAKFTGTKEVKIPAVDFVGLANYDRDNGFSRAKMTVIHQTHTLQMDRGRSIMIDREDMDETGIANLAGQVLSEYVRTKVVPECDAYALSTLFGIAADSTGGRTPKASAYDASASAISQFLTATNAVQANCGFDEDLIAYVDPIFYAALMNDALSKGMIEIADFKMGEINLKVKKINGVIIIPVTADRMKTAYTFVTGATKADTTSITTTVTPSSGTATAVSSINVNDPEAGGFVQDTDGVTVGSDTAKSTRLIVLPRNAASLVKKTEKMRIWTPDQNIDADAYKFDYRIYYDLLVKNSQKENIYALYSTT